ncbi:MAG: uroporphyrinogen decarboxylase family protein [Anaerolineales bacterium]|nr:uroporphyrinogen decarboxylase family protein [Anaerolineales bacterium]
MITHKSRLEACLSGEVPDRPPVALWRHFPVDDQHPARLAAATTAFQRTFDFDLIKVTPASSFCLRDWGARDEWKGAVEGTRSYSVERVIQSPADWSNLPELDPEDGALGRMLDCLRRLVDEFQGEVPVIQTIFSPLSQAKNLAGPAALLHQLRREPEAVLAGLDTIRRTSQNFISAAKLTGIDGVFFAVQHAQDAILTEGEYHVFGRDFDLPVLEAAEDLWLNMLHLHGTQVMFDLFLDYPVAVLNWHDQETPPSLAEGQRRFKGVVCGGLARERELVLGTPEQIRDRARTAIHDTGGRRFILGTGCVSPTNVPYGNLMAARNSVEIV